LYSLTALSKVETSDNLLLSRALPFEEAGDISEMTVPMSTSKTAVTMAISRRVNAFVSTNLFMIKKGFGRRNS